MKILRTKFLPRGTLFALGASALVEMETALRKCIQGDAAANMKSFHKTRGMHVFRCFRKCIAHQSVCRFVGANLLLVVQSSAGDDSGRRRIHGEPLEQRGCIRTEMATNSPGHEIFRYVSVRRRPLPRTKDRRYLACMHFLLLLQNRPSLVMSYSPPHRQRFFGVSVIPRRTGR